MTCSGNEETVEAKAARFTDLDPLLVYPSNQGQTRAEPTALGSGKSALGSSHGLEPETNRADVAQLGILKGLGSPPATVESKYIII